jgi:UDP-glucose 4-epimerase
VVGENGGALIDESTTMRPLTPYGATKAAAEMLCCAYTESFGLRACAVRFTNVYGHGMGGKDTFVVRLMRAAAAGRPIGIYGDGLQERDYLYVEDATSALLRAADTRFAGPLTVGTGVSTSVLGVCDVASTAIGLPIATVHTEAPAGEMRAVRVDISNARSLGYAPKVQLRDGLLRTWNSLLPELEFVAASRAQ